MGLGGYGMLSGLLQSQKRSLLLLPRQADCAAPTINICPTHLALSLVPDPFRFFLPKRALRRATFDLRPFCCWLFTGTRSDITPGGLDGRVALRRDRLVVNSSQGRRPPRITWGAGGLGDAGKTVRRPLLALSIMERPRTLRADQCRAADCIDALQPTPPDGVGFPSCHSRRA